MPTNRALDCLRTPQGLKWAVPAAILLVPAYLFAMSVAAVIGARPGLGWLNLLVILHCWNAMKFAWAGVFAVLGRLRQVATHFRQGGIQDLNEVSRRVLKPAFVGGDGQRKADVSDHLRS